MSVEGGKLRLFLKGNFGPVVHRVPYLMKVRVTIPTPVSNFERVMKALDESHGHLTREEGAMMVHLSPAQFSRQFKRLTGTRFREAQVAMKIRRGACLLVNTNLQIGKIADL